MINWGNNISFLQPLHFFFRIHFHISFSSRSALSNEERKMNTEQQINLKFLVNLGKTPPQTLEMLQQLYEDNTMLSICVFEWDKKIKDGGDVVKDGFRSGRPSTSRSEVNTEREMQVDSSDCLLTIRMSESNVKLVIGRLSPKI